MTFSVSWEELRTANRAALALSSAGDDVEGLLTAAVWLAAADRRGEAQSFFARAARKDANAVRSARAALGLP